MKNNLKIVYFATFISTLAIALTSYLNSSFLKNFWTTNQISAIYICASLLTIILILEMPSIFSLIGNRKTTQILSLTIFSSYLIMAFTQNALLVASAFILNFTAISLLSISLDVFVENYSNKGEIGKLRGMYLMIANSAWILAQMASSTILSNFSFVNVYILSAILFFLAGLIFILFLKDFQDKKYQNMSLAKGVKFVFSRKNLKKIYLINFILKFFFVLMIIYMPMYLNSKIGFSWQEIGFIFTFMLLPFLAEFHLGKLSDKIGEKKILNWGFLIASFGTLLIPFIKSNDIFIWIIILFTTRIGAAMIEVMSENYFFKSVPEEDVEILGFFRETSPLAYVFGPIFAILIFSLTSSFTNLFFVLGGILLLGFWISLKIQDIK